MKNGERRMKPKPGSETPRDGRTRPFDRIDKESLSLRLSLPPCKDAIMYVSRRFLAQVIVIVPA